MRLSAFSRPRTRPRRRLGPGRPGWASRSTIDLELAPASECPHCGRTTKTVQGVCADCWGSKGGRQLWVRRDQGSPSVLEDVIGFDPLLAFVLGICVAAIPVAILLLVWIWG